MVTGALSWKKDKIVTTGMSWILGLSSQNWPGAKQQKFIENIYEISYQQHLSRQKFDEQQYQKNYVQSFWHSYQARFIIE